MTRARMRWRGWLGAGLCAASVLLASLTEAQAPGGSPPDPRALTLKMAELLGNTPRLSMTVHAAYDTVQASGQKIEWNEVRTLTLVGTTTDDACAQRGGGRSGGGRAGGGGQAAGVSREGPAASGSLSANPSKASGQAPRPAARARRPGSSRGRAPKPAARSTPRAPRRAASSRPRAPRPTASRSTRTSTGCSGQGARDRGNRRSGRRNRRGHIVCRRPAAGGRSARAIRDRPRDGAARSAGAAVCQPDNGAGRRSHVHQMRIDLVHTSLRRQRSRLRAVRPGTRLLSGSPINSGEHEHCARGRVPTSRVASTWRGSTCLPSGSTSSDRPAPPT